MELATVIRWHTQPTNCIPSITAKCCACTSFPKLNCVRSAALNGSKHNSQTPMGKPTKNVVQPHADTVNKHGAQLVVALAESASREPLAITPDDIFRLYAQFVGDIERTAIAAHRSVDEIVELVEAGGWAKRIAVLIRLHKSGIPGDTERGVNRAINFVQADRMRTVIERIIRAMMNMTEREMLDHLLSVSTDKEGNTTSRILTRPFADLATALEKCHAMTYQALSDTATDRKSRMETEDQNASAGEMHMALVDAMAKARAPR
jgi:hypothetical protein